jgi:hypothetical protein
MARKNIFVFRIGLEDSTPRIWRKLRVPGYFTLAELHMALQIAFDWTDSHFHSFTINSVEYMMDSQMGPDFYGDDVLSEDGCRLDDLGLEEGQSFSYLYDFGDSWQHKITVSKILPFREEDAAPRCLGGKNAGPIEDSGGVWGYAEILEILRDPGHKEYQETLDWAGEVDPLAFDPEAVNRYLEKIFPPPRKARSDGEKKPAKGKSSRAGSPDNPDKMFRKLYEQSLLEDDGGVWDDFPVLSGSSGGKKAGTAAGSSGKKAGTTRPLAVGKLKKLYALMARVKELKPWEKLWDTELILIELPDREEPVICSVMGKGGESFGVLVYSGFESIISFFRMVEEESSNPFVALGYQDCLLCQLGARDELFPEERTRLKDLGIRFRGKHDWVYFRKIKPGCQPWIINSGDADHLIEVLGRFIEAYGAFAGGLAVNFEANEVLTHRYSETDKRWITLAGEMPPIPIRMNEFRVEGSEVEPLRFKKQLKNAVEIENLYFPQVLERNEEGVPLLMRLGVIVNNKSGVILDQRFLGAGEDGERQMLDMFINFVVDQGRPETVMVRDKFAAATLKDFCGKIGVKLVHSKGLPKVDEFVRSLPTLLNPLAFPG